MITQRIRGFYDLLAVLQLGCCVVAYWGHFLVVEHFYAEAAALKNYVLYCVLFLMGLLLEASFRYDREAQVFQEGLLNKHRLALRQTLWAAGPVVFFLVATKDAVISRMFLFSFLPVLYVLLLWSAWKLPPIIAHFSFQRGPKERTVLIGSSKKIFAMTDWLARKAQFGLEMVGVLCDERVKRVGDWPVLGRVDDLERIIREQQVTQVIAAELPAWPVFLSRLSALCELLGVRFLVISDLEEKFRHRVIHLENDGRHIFALRQEPLENPFNRALKRALDVAVALPIVLLVLPPMALVVWWLQRRQSPGPLLYCQERAGFHHRCFRILKFRTMHGQTTNAARQATKHDRRIFAAGRWLRRLSLDELPQFVNVLRGEMSVVGPRPHLPEHDVLFARVMQNYYIRSFAKPGITGLAQVRGFRGEATDEGRVRQRIESDLYYLENWSLSADLAIILRTAVQMLLPPGTAY